MSKKVMVTGGAGFIGSHLVERLANEGCRVCVLDNLSTGRRSNIAHLAQTVVFEQGDIRDRETVARLMQGCDMVFHQAAEVSVPRTVEDPLTSAEINDLGTLNILEAARRAEVRRVVLASSCAVYGDDPRLPKDEGLPIRPRSPYALQKRFNEMQAGLYHSLYGLETVCLRYFNVYGPRQDPSSPYSGVISIFMTKALQHAAPIIYGDGGQSRDFVFVRDVVSANLLAAQVSDAAGKVINIGTGRHVSINDLWRMIAAMGKTVSTPVYQAPRPGDIRESLADIQRAVSLLGYTPRRSFEAGLQETFDWYRRKAAGHPQAGTV